MQIKSLLIGLPVGVILGCWQGLGSWFSRRFLKR